MKLASLLKVLPDEQEIDVCDENAPRRSVGAVLRKGRRLPAAVVPKRCDTGGI